VRRLGSVLVLLLVLSTLGSSVQGTFSTDDDLLFTQISFPDGNYTMGSLVNLTFLVMEAGEYVDIDTIEVGVGGFTVNTARPVEMTEVETGIWRGSFKVQEDDVHRLGFFVQVYSFVVKGLSSTKDTTTVWFEDPIRLQVFGQIRGESIYVRPGQWMTIEWQVLLDGEPIDCNVIGSVNIGRDFEPDRIGKGNYRYDYRVPESNESKKIYVSLTAYYTSPDGLFIQGADSEVLYLNYMHVWARRVGKVGGEETSYELHVSDMDGDPVSKADVNLTMEYLRQDREFETKWYNTSTDADGVARVTLAYGDVNEEVYVLEIEGTVTSGNKTQHLLHDLQLEEAPDFISERNDYRTGGFSIEKVPDDYRSGSQGTLEATLYYADEPMAKRWVNCYILTEDQLLFHGNVTTDSDGGLSVPFAVPDVDKAVLATAFLTTETPEGWAEAYMREENHFLLGPVTDSDLRITNFWNTLDGYRDAGTKLEVEDLRRGDRAEVTMISPGTDEEWEAVFYLGCGYALEGRWRVR